MKNISGWVWLTAAFAVCGCSGVNSSMRYGADGQQEYFIDCSGEKMTKCYNRALQLCPQGYFLQQDSQVLGGEHTGGIFGHTKHLGAEAHDALITWKNQVVVRCKPAAETPAAPPR